MALSNNLLSPSARPLVASVKQPMAEKLLGVGSAVVVGDEAFVVSAGLW